MSESFEEEEERPDTDSETGWRGAVKTLQGIVDTVAALSIEGTREAIRAEVSGARECVAFLRDNLEDFERRAGNLDPDDVDVEWETSRIGVAGEKLRAEMEETARAAPGLPSMCAARVRAKIALDRLDLAVKAIKAGLQELDMKLLDSFMENGSEQHSINGASVYPSRQIWAGCTDEKRKEELIAALEADPATVHLIRKGYHSGSLSAYARTELPKDEFGVPFVPEEGTLKDLLAIHPRWTIHVRRRSGDRSPVRRSK